MFSPNCVVVLPFSEIAIKGPMVRSFMEKRLRKNMVQYFEHFGVNVEKITPYAGRMIVHSSEPKNVLDSLLTCFGISSLSLAEEVNFSTIEDLCSFAKEFWSASYNSGSFAVRGKSFSKSFSSKKLEEELGGAVLEKCPNLKVKLKGPDKELHCIAFEKKAYFYFDSLSGASGMPVGSQGRAALLITKKSNPSDALALGKEILRVGCSIVLVSNEKEVLDFEELKQFNSFKDQKLYSISQAKELYNKEDIRAFFSTARSIDLVESDSKLVGVKVFAPLLFNFE